MRQLLNEVKPLTHNEYMRAANKFGPTNNSDHESFAILNEEVEELMDEIGSIQGNVMNFWNLVKSDGPSDKKKHVLVSIRNFAILAACEAIQVAAMAYKAEQTIKAKGEN